MKTNRLTLLLDSVLRAFIKKYAPFEVCTDLRDNK